mmetsp:Transcript_83112/g.258530  ORF Transcript_83112/g.258530 Transcript_83112/m.258530 type:complete len:494 (+) Transcript_83112:29-1510(+)
MSPPWHTAVRDGVRHGLLPRAQQQLMLLRLLFATCWCPTHAAPALQPVHLEFAGEAYEDYRRLGKQSGAETLHSKPVKLLQAQSFRIPGFDTVADGLRESHQGQECISGSDSPSASRCKRFRAYNPTLAASGDGRGVVLMARLSNWSLCEWTGQGRPYADWPKTRWPSAVFEEYHSHMAYTVIPAVQLANASTTPAPAAGAQLLPLDEALWLRTRAPFFEIFRQGVEDPRLLLVRGELRALVAYGKRAARQQPTRLADERVEGVGAFRQALVALPGLPGAGVPPAIGPGDFLPLETDFDRGSQQKNWMPFTHGGSVYAVYQLVPKMKVLLLDEATGSATAAHETVPDAALLALQRADVRGGSQCVPVPEQGLYLGVAHVSRGRGMYTHFFFAFADQPPFEMLGVSREWCFAHEEAFQQGKELLCEGVQFVGGLALLGSPAETPAGASLQLAMAYGVMDCDARVARWPLQRALGAIRFSKRPRRRRRAAAAAEL